MLVDILTLFPEMFHGPFDVSIVRRARERGLLNLNLINIRDFAVDRHRTVDDTPAGGGRGMVMEPGPVLRAVAQRGAQGARVCIMSPAGMMFDQKMACGLAQEEHLILICGHYEGMDERITEILEADEISLGNFVLTGGELAAMVVVDAVARLLPGVLKDGSAQEESFAQELLEYPQYTRPREYAGHLIPDVLLSGHHEEVRRWRRRQSLLRTLGRSPGLLEQCPLTREDKEILRSIRDDILKLPL